MGHYFSGIAKWFSRVYLFAYFLTSLYDLGSVSYSCILQLGVIGAVVFFRFKKGERLSFVPDELLVCLPYFWAISMSSFCMRYDYAALECGLGKDRFLILFIICFAVSLIDTISKKDLFPGGWANNTFRQGIWWTICFYGLMSVALQNVFPPFTIEAYRSVVMNGLLFFGGIPICVCAFWGLLKKPEPVAAFEY